MVRQTYKHALIAVDVVIFGVYNGILKTLLIKMKKWPYLGFWASPGGLIHGNESLDEAATRILREKAGFEVSYLEQLAAFGRVDRDPFGRVVSCAYMALVPMDRFFPKTSQEYADIAWFPIKKLPRLAYDHKEIIRRAVERLRAKLGYTNVVANIMPREFTLGELQDAYEIILGRALDKRNFRKRILSLVLLKRLPKQTAGEAHRPAALFAFRSREPQMINIMRG